MFGVTFTRYCTNCKTEKQIHTTVGYMLEGKDYFIGHSCDVCGEDLCKKDKQILKEAQQNGKDIGVVMH